MGEKEFDELINRYQSGRATEKERASIEKWLDERSAKDPFNELPHAEREEVRINIFKGLSDKMLADEAYLRKAKSISGKTVFYRVAAIIVILAAFSYTLLKFTSPSVEEKITMVHSITSTNGTKKVILSDSSIVWLKGNSSIRYPEKFEGGERNVKLTGEALFEVSKDAAVPFIIECRGLLTEVLGTSFNIKSSETDVEVIVLTGKVSLSSKDHTQHLIVLPNEKAVYNEVHNRIEKVIAKEEEMTAKTAETEYCMRFKATRMEEIIRRIEGKFDIRVSVSDERLNNCTITADFTDQSLDRTLSMIAQTLKIEYEIGNSEVMLKGKGCD